MNPFRDILESASAENKELIVTGDFNSDFFSEIMFEGN